MLPAVANCPAFEETAVNETLRRLGLILEVSVTPFFKKSYAEETYGVCLNERL